MKRFFQQALRDPDKKMLMSIVLSSVVEDLRENPERFAIIFNDNNNDSNHINKQQDAVLEVSQHLVSSLIQRLTADMMNTLESQSQSESDMDIAVAEEKTEIEGTESTESEVVAKVDDTQAAAAEEEEETNSKAQ